MPPLFEVKVRGGEPVTFRGVTLTPFARAVTVNFPGNIPGVRGGLVWNKPVTVLAQTPDGQEQILHIHDVTRLALLGISAVTFFATLLTGLIIARKRRLLKEETDHD